MKKSKECMAQSVAKINSKTERIKNLDKRQMHTVEQLC